MILSPNEIAGLIFWSDVQFGPNMAPKATEHNGHIVQHIPPPGSPERTKIENWLDVAIAVCLAESGGDTHAQNASGASGLWQIMVSAHQSEIHDALVHWETELSNGQQLDIFDPRVNTSVAARIYQRSGWQPWQAYTDGSYKAHLGNGKAAYKYISSKKNLEKLRTNFLQNLADDNATIAAAGAIGLPFTLLAGHMPEWLQPILDFFKEAGLVVGVFILGLILIMLGLWTLIRKTPVGKAAKTGALAAATDGVSLLIPKKAA